MAWSFFSSPCRWECRGWTERCQLVKVRLHDLFVLCKPSQPSKSSHCFCVYRIFACITRVSSCRPLERAKVQAITDRHNCTQCSSVRSVLLTVAVQKFGVACCHRVTYMLKTFTCKFVCNTVAPRYSFLLSFIEILRARSMRRQHCTFSPARQARVVVYVNCSLLSLDLWELAVRIAHVHRG